MILLLGAHGYIGSRFASELYERYIPYTTWSANWSYPKWRVSVEELCSMLRITVPQLVINCAAYIPPESVSLCDQNQGETIRSNVLLPLMLAQACQQSGIPFAHISTGCLWSDGQEHSEDDPPQRAFNGHCGFYIGTKVLAEEAVRANCEQHYIWRVRLPFDEVDHPRNYLSKLARFDEVWNHKNTICHRGDFVKACLDLWQMRADWGTYHCCNPGSISANDIVRRLLEYGISKDLPKMVAGQPGASLLSVRKLMNAGVKIRPVEEALEDSIKNWKPNV